MADINMAPCQVESNIPDKVLPSPPPCSAGRAIQYRDISPEYKGPFKNMSTLSVPIEDVPITPAHALQGLRALSIPKKWSWRETGGNKIEDGRRNQRECGCCWAFALVSSLGDRYALKHNIAAPYPSVANLVSCGGPWVGSRSQAGNFAPANHQCACGGTTLGGGKWLEINGVRSEQCWPYSTISAGNPPNVAPNCPNLGNNCCVGCCGTSDAKPRYTARKGSTQQVIVRSGRDPNLQATIRAIQTEIMGRGPVTSTIFVPPNFMDWWTSHQQRNMGRSNLLTEDIFKPNGPPTQSGHGIVLTGWGEKNGVKYWEIRNSWGSPAYAYLAMSSSIPQQNWYGLDVPIIRNNSYQGGVVTLEAGPLTRGVKYAKGTGGSTSGGGWGGQNVNWQILAWLAIVLLAVVLIAIIIRNLLN